jgi:hypothetical protein
MQLFLASMIELMHELIDPYQESSSRQHKLLSRL